LFRASLCDSLYEITNCDARTTVLMVRESQLIERIRRQFRSTGAGLGVGIGDDAAVLRPSPRSQWVITTDAFLEDVHFLRKMHSPGVVGYKSLARATSDIAAMGAAPRFFFLTLGLPDDCTGAWFNRFLRGMAAAARQFGLTLAGGDTTKYPKVLISFTVLGEMRRGKAVLRSGAKPGDLLCVSGELGEAEFGLQLVLKGLSAQRRWEKLLKKHAHPEPRLELGQWLAQRGVASAMIDTSDGLSTDLGHICDASGVGAVVWESKVPLPNVPAALKGPVFDPLKLALHGGEDYELLFTVPKGKRKQIPSQFRGVPVTIIGEITRKKSVFLVGDDGRKSRLNPGGWDPFRK
jgi:thiamine-monophosphate kinase